MYDIIEKNDTMNSDFEVSEYESDLSESNDNAHVAPTKGEARSRVPLGKFRVYNEKMREYIPCLENKEAIKKLRSTGQGSSSSGIVRRRGRGWTVWCQRPRNTRILSHGRGAEMRFFSSLDLDFLFSIDLTKLEVRRIDQCV
ncbi:uncharacterized protein M6B38_358010 [Iris pallida]|uniref:Uncharacterized protein n=1 Tax=Iris pallida TaxID=29817 RepID=A0AAX6GKZ9_IRIPA|nr:uncharacterized protein M6B38_358005 [Iris pallida]KAJ6829439.1 uncharacterized protein M6B38_358010 [Iris pallida]